MYISHLSVVRLVVRCTLVILLPSSPCLLFFMPPLFSCVVLRWNESSHWGVHFGDQPVSHHNFTSIIVVVLAHKSMIGLRERTSSKSCFRVRNGARHVKTWRQILPHPYRGMTCCVFFFCVSYACAYLQQNVVQWGRILRLLLLSLLFFCGRPPSPLLGLWFCGSASFPCPLRVSCG